MSLLVVTPSGRFEDLPADELDELLRDVFLDDPESYWSAADGDAGLHFDDGKTRARLVLLYQAGRGYYVSYYRAGDGTEHVLQQSALADTPVTVYFGGEPLQASSRMFVTPSQAWGAISQFVADPHRLPAPGAELSWAATGKV